MNTLYILQNQHGYFLGKNKEWLDGREANALFRSIHKDEAINMMFEVNTQDVELRISIKECEANAKKIPTIPLDELPPPLPKDEISDEPAQAASDKLFDKVDNVNTDNTHRPDSKESDPLAADIHSETHRSENNHSDSDDIAVNA